MIRRAISGLLAVGLCVTVCSCEQQRIPVELSQSGTTNVRFESEADAQRAATRVYERYLETSDAISRDGGANPSRIAEFVTADELKREIESANYLAEQDLKIAGESKLALLQIQNADLASGALSAYTCVDFSGTKVLNSAGGDVTPPKRLDRQTTVSKFVWRADGLVVDDVSAWSGKSIC